MRSTRNRRRRRNLNRDQKDGSSCSENAEKVANAHSDHPKAEAEGAHTERTVGDRTEIGVGEENGVDRQG